VNADERLTVFMELESAIWAYGAARRAGHGGSALLQNGRQIAEIGT
jgi:hypothetical protein